jgi:hypothetical protein
VFSVWLRLAWSRNAQHGVARRVRLREDHASRDEHPFRWQSQKQHLMAEPKEIPEWVWNLIGATRPSLALLIERLEALSRTELEQRQQAYERAAEAIVPYCTATPSSECGCGGRAWQLPTGAVGPRGRMLDTPGY